MQGKPSRQAHDSVCDDAFGVGFHVLILALWGAWPYSTSNETPVAYSTQSQQSLRDSAKNVTVGFKLIAQGLYKGVRNPANHGADDFRKQEVVQIMITCSLPLGQLQIIEDES